MCAPLDCSGRNGTHTQGHRGEKRFNKRWTLWFVSNIWLVACRASYATHLSPSKKHTPAWYVICNIYQPKRHSTVAYTQLILYLIIFSNQQTNRPTPPPPSPPSRHATIFCPILTNSPHLSTIWIARFTTIPTPPHVNYHIIPHIIPCISLYPENIPKLPNLSISLYPFQPPRAPQHTPPSSTLNLTFFLILNTIDAR